MNNIISKFLFFLPVRILRGEPIYKYLREVRKVESFTKDELYIFQQDKVRNLLKQGDNIPYIKKVLQSNHIELEHDAPVDVLNKFPVTDKFLLSKNYKLEYRNREVKRHIQRSTSGSTGIPFKFYKDRFSTAYMDAIMYQVYSWHNIKIGERQARFWGMPTDIQKKKEAKIKDLLMNRARLSAFDLDESSMQDYYNFLQRFKPGYFYGYPSLIYEFAKFCHNANKSNSNAGLKAILITGEKATSSQIEFIENVFKTRVFQEYGCTEIGVIGFQCQEGNMHVMSPNVILEVIKDGNPVKDEAGEIVVTELNAASYPFIRYKTGDIGIDLTKDCNCGISWPLVQINEGRRDDYILTPDGRKVYDAILAYTFGKHENVILSFKAFQQERARLEIEIVPGSEYSDNFLDEYERILREKLGNEIEIVFNIVNEIKREKSGKLRYFVSKITESASVL